MPENIQTEYVKCQRNIKTKVKTVIRVLLIFKITDNLLDYDASG